MNISSQTFPTNGLNSSHQFIFNINEVEISLVVQIITIVFGLPTNSYVIWLIMSGTGNGLSTEIFILNLSICEIFLCTESLLAIFVHQSKVLAMIVNFVDGLIITSCPLFQCLICVERYLAVFHPVTFLKYKPLRYRLICSVIVWVAVFISCGVTIASILWNLIAFHFCFVLLQFLLFLSIQLFCLVVVLRALKQPGPGERKREKEENHMKRRAFYLILISTVMMLVLYVPYITLIIPQWVSAKYASMLMSVSYISFSLAGLVQPLFFLYQAGKLPFDKCQ